MTSRSDDVTLGELSRRMDRFEENIQRSLKAIDDRLASQVVSRDYYEARHKVLEDDVIELRARMDTAAGYRWSLFVGVITAIILAAGAVVAAVVR